MTKYARAISPQNTPQTQPLIGQIANNGGGFSWEVEHWTRLDRFLILGCEGGSYYAGFVSLTREACEALMVCAAEDIQRTVDRIVEISVEGRAPKNDPAIFCLALLASDTRYSAFALARLNEVCRIGTHLFQFVDSVTQFRGWGRALKRAVSNWYLNRRADNLAYQITKYQQRGGWSHRDVLRCCHAQTDDFDVNQVLGYAAHKSGKEMPLVTGHLLQGVEAIKQAKDAGHAAFLIREHGLVRECVPTQFLNEPVVWEALLYLGMPLTAMIRNLGKMSSIGVLKPNTKYTQMVCDQLRDKEALAKQRIHPFNVLLALTTYEKGEGVKGSLTWKPVNQIMDALEDTYDASFASVEPTGKRYMVGIDVSGSMAWSHIANTHLTARDAAGCMAATLVRSEEKVACYAFCHYLKPMPITKRSSLAEVRRMTQDSDWGGTDCALPMIHAMKEEIPVDVFCIYTDSDTNSHSGHPAVVLQQYRRKMGIDAKLIVVAFVANRVSIADPNDAGMMDVVGFDAGAPKVMADFAQRNPHY